MKIFTTYTLDAQYISPTHIKYVTTYVRIPQDTRLLSRTYFQDILWINRHDIYFGVSGHNLNTFQICHDIYMYVSGHWFIFQDIRSRLTFTTYIWYPSRHIFNT